MCTHIHRPQQCLVSLSPDTTTGDAILVRTDVFPGPIAPARFVRPSLTRLRSSTGCGLIPRYSIPPACLLCVDGYLKWTSRSRRPCRSLFLGNKWTLPACLGLALSGRRDSCNMTGRMTRQRKNSRAGTAFHPLAEQSIPLLFLFFSWDPHDQAIP